MNRRQKSDRKPHRHAGWTFVGPVGACVSLILGLALLCPQVRSHAGLAPSAAERSVLYQAQQAITEKKYADAQKVLSDFMSQNKDAIHYLIPFTLGNALALEGQNDDALTCYRQATGLYDADAALWLNMGKVSYQLGQFDRAGDCLHKAYALSAEKDPDLLYQAAVCCIRAGKFQQAEISLERICAFGKAETRDDWFAALVDVYLKLGKHSKAVATLQRLLKEKGDQPRWSKLLAHVYMEDGKYKQAAAAFALYLNMADVGREDVVRLGDLYRLAGIPLKAARQYERALQWSESPDDYERIVEAYLTARHSLKALETLTQALAKRPSARLWHLAGGIYYNREDYRKAYDAFKCCFQMAPENGDAALYMGYCALKLDKPNEAVQAFESATRFSRQREKAQKALAEIRRLAQRDTKQ